LSPKPAWHPAPYICYLLELSAVSMEDWRSDWENLRRNYSLAEEFHGGSAQAHPHMQLG
jgi:hypothetical protein